MFYRKFSHSSERKVLYPLVVLSLLMLQIVGNRAEVALASPVVDTIKQVEVLNNKSNFESSISLLLNALSKHPNSETLIASFRHTYTLHLYNQISNGYRQIRTNQQNVEAYLEIARSYALMGDQIKAMETLLDASLSNPKAIKIWMAIGTIELKAKRDAEAISVFKEILRFDPDNGQAHNNIAFIQTKSDDARLLNLKRALWHSEKALYLEPKNSNFLDTLAEIKYQLGEKKEAIQTIKKAIQLDPSEDFYKIQLRKFEAD